MKTIIHSWAELTVRRIACLALACVATGCASDRHAVVVAAPVSIPAMADYCAVAQKEIASSRVPARNVLVTDYQAFARAKPSVKPLETLQYVGYADSQHSKARVISCKLHSAERIRAEYGATAAGESSTCARLNRRTLDAVMLSLTDRQKKKMPFKGTIGVLLEPDEQAANESQWLESFTMVQTDAGGTLRIRAKSLRGEGAMRVSSKGGAASGRQYCHLIAPDYLKRVLLGEVQPSKSEFPDRGQTASR
jgi:hypothetical protein